MKTLTSFSLLVLLSTAAAAAAQSPGTSATAPGRVGAPTDASADYRLVAGDKLRIEVYKDTQLSQSLQVRPDGKITLPLAGDILAAGRTPTELRDSITSALKAYITTPTVTVIVVETVPPVIYVMGEVNTPGPQPLKSGMTVMQALAVAGGFKEFANTKNITVQRGTDNLKYNYKAALNGEQREIVLRPGDTIVVR